MNESLPISQAAHDELVAEIEKLETVDRPAIAEKIAAAREDGDLKENAEYHAARNDQAFLETKILKLRDRLRNSVVVEATGGNHEVAFGSTVKLRDTNSGKEVTYTIVSSFDQDVSQGKLSNSSPVAEAVMGAKQGAKVKALLPNGSQREFEVLEIS